MYDLYERTGICLDETGINFKLELETDTHICLICYEKPSDFCHRHLVAEWLNECGFECREWLF